jgi:peptidoglycan/LPS O-acetylase OafA/YrhL
LGPRLFAAADTILRAGMFGVDLFFVLSSFLITELLLREKQSTGRVHIQAFYVRRILRIWPLYFTAIGIAWAAQFIWHTEHLPRYYIIGFLALSGNWVCAFRRFPLSVIGPLWSVSIEEQFYLSWPWALRNLSLQRVRQLAAVLLIVPTLVRIFLYLRGSSQIMFWCNTFSRIDPILAGILISTYLKGRSLKLSPILRVGWFVLGLTGLIGVSYFCRLPHQWVHPDIKAALFSYPLATICVTSMFLSVLGAADNGFAWMYRATPRYLGKVSYGLYVFHTLGLLIAASLLGTRTGIARYSLIVIMGFVTTLLLASLSYRFLEEPFLKMKDRFTYVLSTSTPVYS